MKIKLRSTKDGLFYLPKELREQWGIELELIPDAMGGVIYPKDADLEKVIECLEEVVLKDLKLRVKHQKQK